MFRYTLITLSLCATGGAFAATAIVSADMKTAATVYLGNAISRDSNNLPVNVAGAIASGFTQQSQSAAQLTDLDGRTANAFVVSQATWASADQGTIGISWGWTAQSSGASTAFDTGGAINWSYTFVAAADGVFRANWSITTPGTTDVTGLNKLNTSDNWISPGGGGLGGSHEDPSGSGISLVPLLAGETYTMGLSNVGFAGDPQGYALRLANGEARIQWLIDYTAPVPEPETWALLLAGLCGVGAAAWRRRH